ncbi:hypothetical protein EDEG_00614 [Edhazardia aedis USNM 41457]|uniref:Homeobox domain-containing protein n=1 Tax=Edhazardia aedis (strain USNM 41457) TaxID=1003232 RepID=J9DC44_EDHAE|nr:hypothetical protein EDEG_00614 [Edhazardia aedis USNM 41457]|eukprot:EJW05311.1 hypothetical protein EDEG_00614 [Edhazardia aedis USNM 41457]
MNSWYNKFTGLWCTGPRKDICEDEISKKSDANVYVDDEKKICEEKNVGENVDSENKKACGVLPENIFQDGENDSMKKSEGCENDLMQGENFDRNENETEIRTDAENIIDNTIEDMIVADQEELEKIDIEETIIADDEKTNKTDAENIIDETIEDMVVVHDEKVNEIEGKNLVNNVNEKKAIKNAPDDKKFVSQNAKQPVKNSNKQIDGCENKHHNDVMKNIEKQNTNILNPNENQKRNDYHGESKNFADQGKRKTRKIQSSEDIGVRNTVSGFSRNVSLIGKREYDNRQYANNIYNQVYNKNNMVNNRHYIPNNINCNVPYNHLNNNNMQYNTQFNNMQFNTNYNNMQFNQQLNNMQYNPHFNSMQYNQNFNNIQYNQNFNNMQYKQNFNNMRYNVNNNIANNPPIYNLNNQNFNHNNQFNTVGNIQYNVAPNRKQGVSKNVQKNVVANEGTKKLSTAPKRACRKKKEPQNVDNKNNIIPDANQEKINPESNLQNKNEDDKSLQKSTSKDSVMPKKNLRKNASKKGKALNGKNSNAKKNVSNININNNNIQNDSNININNNNGNNNNDIILSHINNIEIQLANNNISEAEREKYIEYLENRQLEEAYRQSSQFCNQNIPKQDEVQNVPLPPPPVRARNASIAQPTILPRPATANVRNNRLQYRRRKTLSRAAYMNNCNVRMNTNFPENNTILQNGLYDKYLGNTVPIPNMEMQFNHIPPVNTTYNAAAIKQGAIISNQNTSSNDECTDIVAVENVNRELVPVSENNNTSQEGDDIVVQDDSPEIIDGKPKRTRTVLCEEQCIILLKFFSLNAFPKTEERESMAHFLNVKPRTVQIWFQNQRQKIKAQLKKKGQYFGQLVYYKSSKDKEFQNVDLLADAADVVYQEMENRGKTTAIVPASTAIQNYIRSHVVDIQLMTDKNHVRENSVLNTNTIEVEPYTSCKGNTVVNNINNGNNVLAIEFNNNNSSLGIRCNFDENNLASNHNNIPVAYDVQDTYRNNIIYNTTTTQTVPINYNKTSATCNENAQTSTVRNFSTLEQLENELIEKLAQSIKKSYKESFDVKQKQDEEQLKQTVAEKLKNYISPRSLHSSTEKFFQILKNEMINDTKSITKNSDSQSKRKRKIDIKKIENAGEKLKQTYKVPFDHLKQPKIVKNNRLKSKANSNTKNKKENSNNKITNFINLIKNQTTQNTINNQTINNINDNQINNPINNNNDFTQKNNNNSTQNNTITHTKNQNTNPNPTNTHKDLYIDIDNSEKIEFTDEELHMLDNEALELDLSNILVSLQNYSIENESLPAKKRIRNHKRKYEDDYIAKSRRLSNSIPSNSDITSNYDENNSKQNYPNK